MPNKKSFGGLPHQHTKTIDRLTASLRAQATNNVMPDGASLRLHVCTMIAIQRT